MTKPQPPEEVLNWLYFADEDLSSAEIMMKEGIFNKVCFLSQQAVEKGLKAFLLHHKRDIRKTHKVVDLLAECSVIGSDFNKFEDDALTIDRYYLPTRYPDAIVGPLPEGLPGKDQAKNVLEIASKILGFIKDQLGL